MVESCIIPMAEKLYCSSTRKGKKWLFLQDGARAHSVKQTKKWLEERKIELFPHPATSPDLNPIELVWALMKRKLF